MTVELLVPLTWPINYESEQVVEEIEILKSYKEAFLVQGALKPILQLLVKVLGVDSR